MTTATETTRYGTARAAAWGRLHQQLAARAGWEGFDGELPIVEGTLIRLHVDHLPGDRSPEPLWLWSSRAGTSADQVDRAWKAFLRRFDIEHTFRFFKQALGWTRPKLRDPAAADRWTWILLACYAQLYLARHLAADIRLPWQRPCPPGRLIPARVRRGFRNIRQALPGLAGAPKPGKPGPGRPPGSKNRRPATRHDVGKDRQTRPAQQGNPQADGLNDKLRSERSLSGSLPVPANHNRASENGNQDAWIDAAISPTVSPAASPTESLTPGPAPSPNAVPPMTATSQHVPRSRARSSAGPAAASARPAGMPSRPAANPPTDAATRPAISPARGLEVKATAVPMLIPPLHR